jgi:hypothetical protein
MPVYPEQYSVKRYSKHSQNQYANEDDIGLEGRA